MKVGINGMGRIGKLVYRILRERGVEVPLVNDKNLNVEQVQHVLKYDSVFGKAKECKVEGNKISYLGKETCLSNFDKPEKIPWSKYGVDAVVEASGVFTGLKECENHKDVKIVVVTAPSKDVPMFVYGVNHQDYASQRIISNASCTTNCLAPLAKIIDDNFGIVEGLMTTVHAVTATQNIVDGIGKSSRSGRSGMNNIIPASTGAATSVGKVIPSLAGKLDGMAMRVPISNVSVVDLVCRTRKETSIEEIAKAVEKFSEENGGIVGTTRDPVVSSDFIGDPRSSVFDINASISMGPNFFKIISWYDNEYGYSCRVCDLLKYAYSKRK
ncbi:glyceraldehyde-3-phosphate dehydrogenase [Encephalitozoon hellem ATCC 50504]|uniref:Glyceraldehyde-3-phosphate dehydrogenase n=1 Tax=Encephalitozoon hellem TaxID=27973 RepID=A0A9Q9CCW9_ENCHE|nr:glyceraldehyde-3-phosphate dehydrogenase [Encephalitozoon hellem ATCC 50504]AFM98604.1 glyceraldehyde-3-phosphate dehydrogenase [Encephalitozoon hellem ATCC 50504]UTX43548.1 glyceraldehyde-3-phosphate dehydrogenase [Encephalitozoon hellem]|eukprot:XP_003887585.1 glyceraldehyde-3-phosphate dehydrogenase [Encephalitozoon hellem ATCC 50504]